jgi:PAS domain S-box-containing protein
MMETNKNILQLKFDQDFEAKYNAHSASSLKKHIRVAYVIFSLLYGLFALTDYILVPQWFSLFFAIRFYIVIPTLLATIAVTFHPDYCRWEQVILLSGFLIGGAAIATMLVLEPLNSVYYGGLFLVFSAGYFMLHLHPYYAIAGGFTILAIFVAGILWTGNMNVFTFSATLFLTAENIMGSLGAFQLERFRRNEFSQIHDLHQIQSQLQSAVFDRNRYLEAVLQTSADGFLVIDSGRKLIQVNDAYCRMSGYAKEELLRMFLYDIDAMENSDETVVHLKQVVDNGSHVFETRHHRKNGTVFNVEVSATFLDIDDGQYVCFCRDITTRKQAENLIRTRLSLMEFASSHTLEELLQQTLDEVGALVDSPVGFYHFVEKDQETLSLQAWSTRTLKEFCKVEGKGMHYGIEKAGVWVDCVRERRPVIHNDYNSLPHRKGLPQGHSPVTRELVVPIMRNGLVVSILGVGNKPVEYSEEDVEIVSYLADVAWEIAEHKRAAEKLSHTMHEKDALLCELYHRINNTMQVVQGMLSLQATEFSANREVQEVVNTTRHRMQAIALVHQLLYEKQDLTRIAIRKYIRELSTMILESNNHIGSTVTIDSFVDDEVILLDTAIPLGLLINELITKSLETACAGKSELTIRIELRKKLPGFYRMHYSDGCISDPVVKRMNKNVSPGLDLISIIGEQQLQGTVGKETPDSLGYVLDFPDNIYKARI